MARTVKCAAVLGSGVMGSGIAAHLANAGVKTHLLDIVPRGKDGAVPSDPAARNALAAGAIAKMAKHKPKPFASPDRAAMVIPGNLDDHLERLGEADWVIEAVIENADIKRSVYGKIAPHLSDHAVLTTNTSGIPLATLTEGMSASLKQRFFVTHFFNPPRYMRLLEIVPGPESDGEVIDGIATFCAERLGKGVVWAKDTPNFIANRVGTFSMMVVAHMLADGYSVEELDTVGGPPLGKPKSAAFRTADLVGLDTLLHVVRNCVEGLPDDESVAVFEPPAVLTKLVESGQLGDKTGGGFYKKAKIDGKRAILALDAATMEYRPKEKVRLASVGAVRKEEDAGKRIAAMLAADDRGGEIARKMVLPTLAYALRRVPEIADRIEDVDRAMRWGFNWDLGPFETIDAIGAAKVIEYFGAADIEVPALLQQVADGPGAFYAEADGVDQVLVPATVHMEALPAEVDRHIQLDKVRARPGGLVHKDTSASVLDLGDGVFCVEFHAKMNAIDDSIISTMGRGLAEAEKNGVGLVLANEGANFSVGANLMLLLMGARGGQWDQVEKMCRDFQTVNMQLRQSPVPVVAAPFGMTLGGGIEACLGADAIQAHLETYAGLVEVGVGLIPGGGGTKEVLVRLLENVPSGVDTFPFVQKAFEAIGMAKVAESAELARELGLMRRSDGITFNRAQLTAHAKARVIGMAQAGYAPPPDPVLELPGREGIANITIALQGMAWSGFVSEHDAHIGRTLAKVLCGGDVAPGTKVTEARLLELEREAFLSLAGEEKSQARMEHMLMNGKPLRN